MYVTYFKKHFVGKVDLKKEGETKIYPLTGLLPEDHHSWS